MAALAASLTVAPTLASAAPNTSPNTSPKSDPSVSQVQKQLGELALKNSQLVEQFDHAQVSVEKREKAATVAHTGAVKANAAYRAMHTKFVQLIQAQYESDSFGAAGALFDSSSNSNYLDRLDTLTMVSTHNAEVVAQVAAARSSATGAAGHAQQLLATARAERDALATQRKSVTAQIKKYQTLLATLNSAQQAAYQRMSNPSVSKGKIPAMHLTQAGTAAARRAVQFALDQIGKPYVFAASGPSSYDCSGLTMKAWEKGGVSLPHSAADQYNYGHHVSKDELQPGDLIFFYQPIGHVTIYAGNGMMVSAPTEGEDVSLVPLSAASDYTGATRLT